MADFSHRDPLSLLGTSAPLEQKLLAIRESLLQSGGGVERIAIATYDAGTDQLKTFVASDETKSRLVHYDHKLADTPSRQRSGHGARCQHQRAAQRRGHAGSSTALSHGGTLAGAAAGTVILGPGLGTSIGAKVGGWAEGLFGKKEEKKAKK